MFSIIIPTMQKNKKVFEMLLDELVVDNIIKEIIIIDNSLSGIDYKSEKIKVLTPEQNIYVNPAWNLGVSKAKSEYIGILNDDLIFPRKFFLQVSKFLNNTKNVGYVGLDIIPKASPDKFFDYPKQSELEFKRIYCRNLCWGSAFFFKKNNYFNIPEKMKVWCGDDYLFWESLKNKLKNFAISNSNILHLHSLTSDRQEFDKIKRQDQIYYKMINPQYDIANNKLSFIENICSIKNEYQQNCKHKVVRFFGIKMKFKWR